MSSQSNPQWIMEVTVYHGPTYGHAVEVRTVTKGRDTDTLDSIGSWKGVGIPENVYEGIITSVQAILTDHLIARYGIQQSIPDQWGYEPEPF